MYQNESATTYMALQKHMNSSISELYYKPKQPKVDELSKEHDFEFINGKAIKYVPIRIIETKRKSIFLAGSKINEEIEDVLTLKELKQIKRYLLKAIEAKKYRLAIKNGGFLKKSELKNCGLDKQEFLDAFFTLLIYNEYKNEFEKLYEKLDSKNSHNVTWDDFSDYLILRQREKELVQSLKPLPFNGKLRTKFSLHNRRETTVKFLYSPVLNRFINVTQIGNIGLWDRHFNFINSYQIQENLNKKIGLLEKKEKSFLRITEAVLLVDKKMLCVATAGRSLIFLKYASENLREDFRISGLPNFITAMDHYFDEKHNTNTLILGDARGFVRILKFILPDVCFYDERFRNSKEFLEKNKISFEIDLLNKLKELHNHSNYIHYHTLDSVHHNYITQLIYDKRMNIIITSSFDNSKSLKITSLDLKRKQYAFEIANPCQCFDYSSKLKILVSAPTEEPSVYVWNMFCTSQPIHKLLGFKAPAIGLKIHEDISYLYALYLDSVLRVWDLKEYKCLQILNLSFFSIVLNTWANRMASYGTFPISLISDNKETDLILCCNDYIGYLVIGEHINVHQEIPISHKLPISTIIYNSLYKMIITCDHGSNISFWNLMSGKKIFSINRAHDDEEITAACLDQSQKRLFTAARDGTIKLWNAANGQLLQNFEALDNSEVTGLSINDKKQYLVSVGWNKSIAFYSGFSFDVSFLPNKPEFVWKDSHQDDILCSDHYMNFLATGSYDGEIKLWNIETERFYYTICKSKENVGPIDKLLFLKNRNEKTLRTVTLVASANGFVYFWRNEKLLGKFYSSFYMNESSLALQTNHDDTVLFTGDTRGLLYLWDLSQLFEDDFEKPEILNFWRCHDASITTCQYIKLQTTIELICTVSADYCCRVWTIKGDYVGVFGQESKWNLRSSKTFQFLSTSTKHHLELSNRKESEVKEIKKPTTRITKFSFDNENHLKHVGHHRPLLSREKLNETKYFDRIKKSHQSNYDRVEKRLIAKREPYSTLSIYRSIPTYELKKSYHNEIKYKFREFLNL